MRTHATAQQLGDRSHQCDATATYTDPTTGARAYVLLDGIGSTPDVQAWTRTTARRLARAAARNACPETGLRLAHTVATAQRRHDPGSPSAVAVVAVTVPGQPLLRVSWSGDSRAYLIDADRAWKLTSDHNLRQHQIAMGAAPEPGARNRVLSYLGYPGDTPDIGTCAVTATGRLLLASDGAYEPLEDAGEDLAPYLTGSPRTAARTLTTAAIDHTSGYADNATALVADLT